MPDKTTLFYIIMGLMQFVIIISSIVTLATLTDINNNKLSPHTRHECRELEKEYQSERARHETCKIERDSCLATQCK